MIDSATLSKIAQHDRNIRAWAHLASDVVAKPAAKSKDGPLAGLHFGVKDVIDVRGMPTYHGSGLQNVPPARFDAACVAVLREAGATPIGKTVTAEFAVTAPGPTCNPWNPAHTPGGSSSGSAAAVAAGMVPLALGTQTGGSIIRPAAFNGVVGFKPSFGCIPRTGMQVLCDSLDTIGWFTADVALARQVATLFMGEAALPQVSPAGLAGLRIAVLPAKAAGPLSDESLTLLTSAAERLSENGATVAWPQADELFSRALATHAITMRYELARGLLPVLRAEPAALRPQTAEIIEEGLAINPGEYASWQSLRQALQADWLTMLAAYDLVLTPSAPGTAPAGLTSTGTSVFNRTWSLLGWPSVNLPISQSSDGLPLGVQCVGKPAGDMALLAWAEILHTLLDERERKQP